MLTSVPVELNPKGYTAGAGAICRSLRVGSEGIVLRCREVRRRIRRGLRRRRTRRAVTARPTLSSSGSWPPTASARTSTLSGCSAANSALMAHWATPTFPATWSVFRTSIRRAIGARPDEVATGISGLADTDPSEYEFSAFGAALPACLVSQRQAGGRQPGLADRADRRRQQHDRGGHHRDRPGPLVPLPRPAGRPGLGRTVQPARPTTTSLCSRTSTRPSPTSPRPTDLAKLSAEFAGDAYAPSVFSPSVFSPSVFSPRSSPRRSSVPSVFSPVGVLSLGVQPVGVLAVGLLPVGVQPVGVLAVGVLARRSSCRRCSRRRCSARRCSRPRCSPTPSPAPRPAA